MDRIIGVKFVSDWAEGLIEMAAKLNLDSFEVFDIEASDRGAEYECLNRQYIIIDGAEFDFPVTGESNDFEYEIINNDVIREVLCRACEVCVNGVYMPIAQFEHRMNHKFPDLRIPPEMPVQVIDSGRVMPAKALLQEIKSVAPEIRMEREISRASIECALIEHLKECDGVSFYGDLIVSSMQKADTEARCFFGIKARRVVNELAYVILSNEVVLSAARIAESMRSIAEFTTSSQPRLRALIAVSGGSPSGYVNDSGVDVEVFDWDNYNALDSKDQMGMAVPEHFRDLAEVMDIPVRGDSNSEDANSKPKPKIR